MAKSLNGIIAMVDKLQEQDNNNQEAAPDQALADVITSHSPGKRRTFIYIFIDLLRIVFTSTPVQRV